MGVSLNEYMLHNLAHVELNLETTGSLYFWVAHLASPLWGLLASWCYVWLEAIDLIAGIGTQLQRHMRDSKNCKASSCFAPAPTQVVLNTFALEVMAFLDVISMWW